MSQVLANFRKKYPEYGDMSDLELATKLSKKYPEYSDVLSEISNKKQSDILPTAGQIAGNIAGFTGGAMLGHPYIGSAVGGTAGRIAGRLAQQNIDLMQKNPMQELALQSPLSTPIMPIRTIASMSPEQINSFGKEIKDTAIGEAIAIPFGYGIGKTLQMASKLINLGGRKTAQAIAEKADKGINKLSETLSNKYNDFFSKVGRGEVSNDNVFNSIKQAIDAFPEGSGSGKLKSILNRLSDVETISAKELHNLKQEISKLIPKSVWNGISDSNAIQNSYENIYWTITKELEKLGGKAYQGLTEEYKNFKQAERLARRMFMQEGIPTNPSAQKAIFDYTVPRERAVRFLSNQLPKAEQFARDFEAWRRGQEAKAILGAGSLGAYLWHRGATEKLMGKK